MVSRLTRVGLELFARHRLSDQVVLQEARRLLRHLHRRRGPFLPSVHYLTHGVSVCVKTQARRWSQKSARFWSLFYSTHRRWHAVRLKQTYSCQTSGDRSVRPWGSWWASSDTRRWWSIWGRWRSQTQTHSFINMWLIILQSAMMSLSSLLSNTKQLNRIRFYLFELHLHIFTFYFYLNCYIYPASLEYNYILILILSYYSYNWYLNYY